MSNLHFETLKNGLRLILQPMHHAPIVSMRLGMLGGLRYETTETNGLSHFVSEALLWGTQHRSAIQLARDIEAKGGSIRAMSGRNSMCLSLDILSRFLDAGIDIFFDVLFKPAFHPNEISKLKPLIQNELSEQRDHPGKRAGLLFLKHLFPHHPYGFNPIGIESVIARMTHEQLKHCWQTLLYPKTMTLAVVGDIDVEKLKAILTPFLESIPKGAKLPPSVPLESKFEFKIATETFDKQQAHIVLGFPGGHFLSPDRYALDILQAALASQGGRLFLKLREELNLAYAVSASHVEGIDPGYFSFYIGLSPDKIPTALQAFHDEIERIKNEPFSEAELNRVKNYMVGNYEIDLQEIAPHASSHAYNVLYGLGIDHLENYPNYIFQETAEHIRATAQTTFDFRKCTVAVVQPSGSPKIDPAIFNYVR